MTTLCTPAQLDYARKHLDAITKTTQLLTACQTAQNDDEYATALHNIFHYLVKEDISILVYFPAVRKNVRNKLAPCRALLCHQMNEGKPVPMELLNNMILLEKMLAMIRLWTNYVPDEEEPVCAAFSETA